MFSKAFVILEKFFTNTPINTEDFVMEKFEKVLIVEMLARKFKPLLNQ